MYLKLLTTIFLLLSTTLSYAYGSKAPRSSKRPVARPANLNTTDIIRDGVIRNGQVRLSLSFPEEAIVHQRRNREAIFPLMHYLKNEYPHIDFYEFAIKSITVVSRSIADYSALKFYSDEHETIYSTPIYRSNDPYTLFGEYTKTDLYGAFIDRPFLYLGVEGAVAINNIIVDLEYSNSYNRRNLSIESYHLPQLGNLVPPVSGLPKTQNLNEEHYIAIVEEIERMNSPFIEEQVFVSIYHENDIEATVELEGINSEGPIVEEDLDIEINTTTDATPVTIETTLLDDVDQSEDTSINVDQSRDNIIAEDELESAELNPPLTEEEHNHTSSTNTDDGGISNDIIATILEDLLHEDNRSEDPYTLNEGNQSPTPYQSRLARTKRLTITLGKIWENGSLELKHIQGSYTLEKILVINSQTGESSESPVNITFDDYNTFHQWNLEPHHSKLKITFVFKDVSADAEIDYNLWMD